MTNRCNGLATLVVLIGGLIFSIGYNFYQAHEIKTLQNTINCHSAVDPFDCEKIKQEILRLENVKYN
jgi:hypothetical protein